MTIKYLGQQPLLEHDERWLAQKGDEIVVMQQHCGGENLTVFKGYVKPYSKRLIFLSHILPIHRFSYLRL